MKDIGSGFCSGSILTLMNQFCLQGAKETLHRGVVVAVAGPAHTTHYFIDPLLFAYYLGMFSDDQRRCLIGFNEYYLYKDLDDGYSSSPISAHFNLNEICEVAELANIRTIYLKPQYRRWFNSYVKLYVATAKHARELGVKYTTFSTSSKDSYLQRIYRKMGGKLICNFDIPDFMEGIDIFLLDLDDLVNQPIAIRFGRDEILPSSSSTSSAPGIPIKRMSPSPASIRAPEPLSSNS